MKSFFRYLYLLCTGIFTIYLFFLNYKLYYHPEIKHTANGYYNADVIKQLRHIKNEIDHGAAERMQQIYPEGFLFTHVLNGLTWAEVVENIKPSDTLYKEALVEIEHSISQLESENGTRIFPPSLKPQYGIFYRGWKNYLLGKKISLLTKTKLDTIEINHYEKECAAIADAYRDNPLPYLESYTGLSWPPDNVVAVASLALHDKILPTKYADFIEDWLNKVKKTLDKDSMIAHKTNFKTGIITEQAKGSSQSLMLVFLFDIDSSFGTEQFNRYKKHFADSRFGLPGIREHKKGIDAAGDIDSGPVILDIGGSASLVGVKAISVYKDFKLMTALRNSIEAFGMSYKTKKEKKYLFGKLPVADCFIAWSNVKAYSEPEPSGWRLKFQLITFFLVSIFILIYFRFLR